MCTSAAAGGVSLISTKSPATTGAFKERMELQVGGPTGIVESLLDADGTVDATCTAAGFCSSLGVDNALGGLGSMQPGSKVLQAASFRAASWLGG